MLRASAAINTFAYVLKGRNTAMETMRAVGLNARGGSEQLVYEDVARPDPGVGEMLVRVHATAITPTEFTWAPTWRMAGGGGRERPFPIIPGHEFSGVVHALGPGAAAEGDLAVGKAVYGLNAWDWQGAEAEYCLALPAQLAAKPQSLDHAHAAVVPISGLTAWQALFSHAQLAAGQRVLIHGAAGGVGPVPDRHSDQRPRGARV